MSALTITKQFQKWCRERESNPRRITLTVWAEYNAPDATPQMLDAVWRMLWTV